MKRPAAICLPLSLVVLINLPSGANAVRSHLQAVAAAEPSSNEPSSDEDASDEDASDEETHGKVERTAEQAAFIRQNAATTVVEARGRARLLHETLHGALQVMHRDFFREDEGLKIPSRSLEDVFREVSRSQGVQLRWIAVDLNAMDIDNEPKTDFEKAAVRSLKSGKLEYEQTSDSVYHFAGRITLSATCLSCHASRRSSNDDRAAGLVIRMPLQKRSTP